MAKEQDVDNFDLDDNFEEEGRGSKILSAIIGLLIFIFLLSGVALFIKLDIGGVGNGVLRQYLKDVPVVNKVLPSVSDSQLASEYAYDFDNISDAVAYIRQLEAKVKTLEGSNTDSTKKVSDLQAEVDRLKVFEDKQDEFNKKVLDFDKNVVFNDKAPDIMEYQKYYEQIAPDNAAKIYEQVLAKMQSSELVKAQAQRYSKMEPKNAATALEVMTADLDIVSDILTNMSTAKAAAIMQEMTPDYCAKITKKMSLLETSN